jgi:hypothetical protein
LEQNGKEDVTSCEILLLPLAKLRLCNLILFLEHGYYGIAKLAITDIYTSLYIYIYHRLCLPLAEFVVFQFAIQKLKD